MNVRRNDKGKPKLWEISKNKLCAWEYSKFFIGRDQNIAFWECKYEKVPEPHPNIGLKRIKMIAFFQIIILGDIHKNFKSMILENKILGMKFFINSILTKGVEKYTNANNDKIANDIRIILFIPKIILKATKEPNKAFLELVFNMKKVINTKIA